jgi:uncharacterized protein YjgD (DUF1641 family)
VDTEVALLNQKIDLLTEQLAAQRQQIDRLEANTHSTSDICQKMDAILDQLEAQRQRSLALEELKNDLIPIGNQMVKLTIDELAEIGSDFQLEDLLFLVKRLLRDTKLLSDLLDKMESTVELVGDVQTIGNQAFNQSVLILDRLEREGYFTFARSSWRILEKIVAEFDEEDVNALGDNIVLILNTIKSMTQPEIMNFVHNTLLVAEKEVEKPVDISYSGLIRQMRDPSVRRGLALTMRVLQVVGTQPEGNGNGTKNN